VFGPALPALVVLRPSPARALGPKERETVRAVLNSTRFQDCAPAAIQATLLDEGQYLCSIRAISSKASLPPSIPVSSRNTMSRSRNKKAIRPISR
jgi:hypothetical protein